MIVGVAAVAVLIGIVALLFIGTGMRPFVSQGNIVDGWAIRGEPWAGGDCGAIDCGAEIALAKAGLGGAKDSVVSAALYTEDAPLRSGSSLVVVFTMSDGSRVARGISCHIGGCSVQPGPPRDPFYRDSGGVSG